MFSATEFILQPTHQLKIDIEGPGFIELTFAGTNCTISLEPFDGMIPPSPPSRSVIFIQPPTLVFSLLIAIFALGLLYNYSMQLVRIRLDVDTRREEHLRIERHNLPITLGIIAMIGMLLVTPFIFSWANLDTRALSVQKRYWNWLGPFQGMCVW
ncbi:MAG: hypothetical protein GF411_18830 [Candidatus Lokiarchaeota archaeon]|nr:hypothetical protein [Candidatus Lokiarchaeota archaeon]